MPASNDSDNKAFNYYFSSVRVGSEHCIGYLKGRFQSLQELRLSIWSPADLEMLAIWLHACIILHSYAIDMENNFDLHQDEFLINELASSQHGSGTQMGGGRSIGINTERENSDMNMCTVTRSERDINLVKGREFRKRLKSKLISVLLPCT